MERERWRNTGKTKRNSREMPRMKYICGLEGFCGENEKEAYNLIHRSLYSWKRTNRIIESSDIIYKIYYKTMYTIYKNDIYFGGNNLH